MQTLYEALVGRRADLRGYRADPAEVKSLRRQLSKPLFDPLLLIYRELPVCGMITAVVLHDGEVHPPDVSFAVDYDSDTEHEFHWLSPAQMIDRIMDGARGGLAFQAGYVPIGMCSFGGDDYFLSTQHGAPHATPLYRVYYDWISHPDLDDPPVPPEAIDLVHHSFEDIIDVARFSAGAERGHCRMA